MSRRARDTGDAWVVAANGGRYWGTFGAAGLLAHDTSRGVLLQHRVGWSDHGGTWGIPGGARHKGENAVTAAIREAQEEAGVPETAIHPKFSHTIDLGGWSYTTIIASVLTPFDATINDPESHALEWVAVDQVQHFRLHPGFKESWPLLRSLLDPNPEAAARLQAEGAVTAITWRARKPSP